MKFLEKYFIFETVYTFAQKEMEKEENIQATEQIHQGLCVLTELDAVAVQQHLEVFEILTGFETQNLFTIWDKSEKQILLAAVRR